MKLLHPFMPFISEEIWQYIGNRSKEEALCISEWPMYDSSYDSKIDIEQFETFKFVFFRHGATFPEFDELGVSRFLHIDVIELDVSQIKLHDFCDENDEIMMIAAESLSKDSCNA